MIWGEEGIRDRVRQGVGAARGKDFPTPVTFREAELLLNEIDKLRQALQSVKKRAWSNHLIHKIVNEALK